MSVRTAYLVAYNLVQLVGWAVVLGKTAKGLVTVGPHYLYGEVEWETRLFQTLMVMEVVHALLRLVRTPASTAALQITSRLVIVWLVTYAVPSSRASLGVAMYSVAWSVTEVVRYSFYLLALVERPLWAVTYLRYTLFIVLYPLGVLGEITTVCAALAEVKRRRLWSLEMPNALNFGLSFYGLLCVFLLAYFPFFPQLYFYMFAQRKKVLGNHAKDQAKKAM